MRSPFGIKGKVKMQDGRKLEATIDVIVPELMPNEESVDCPYKYATGYIV